MSGAPAGAKSLPKRTRAPTKSSPAAAETPPMKSRSGRKPDPRRMPAPGVAEPPPMKSRSGTRRPKKDASGAAPPGAGAKAAAKPSAALAAGAPQISFGGSGGDGPQPIVVVFNGKTYRGLVEPDASIQVVPHQKSHHAPTKPQGADAANEQAAARTPPAAPTAMKRRSGTRKPKGQMPKDAAGGATDAAGGAKKRSRSGRPRAPMTEEARKRKAELSREHYQRKKELAARQKS